MYTYKAYVNRVVDGDTIDCDIDLGFYMIARIRLRLARVNTPETYGVSKDSDEYVAGMAAKQFVIDAIEGEEVIIKTSKTGKFGRWLAEIYYGVDFEINLNDKLIEEGLAKLYGA